jgi:KDO2-lipid IV(A) lauroyltransferase
VRALRQHLAVVALRFAEFLVRSLPPTAALALGRVVALAVFRLDARHRWRARENVRVAFGGLDRAARERIVRGAFVNFGLTLVETLHFERQFATLGQLRRKARLRGDWEALFRDLHRGGGGILVTGHLGNWELGARAFRLYEVPLRVVYRPLDNPHLNAHVVAARGGPSAVIRHRGGAGGALAALRAGSWVGILADTNARGQGEFAPFFGLAAATYGAPVLLAVRQGVPFYVGATLRRRGAPFRFDLVVRRLLLPAERDAPLEAVREGVAAMNRALEDLVRLAPDQYLWTHRRWKDRPRGETPGPHLPLYDRRRLPLRAAKAARRGG